MIGCGLSLEGVAGVDQEGPSGEVHAKLCLKRLQSFSNEGTRILWCPAVLGAQWLCLWASHEGDTTPTLGHRVNILHTM